LELQILAGYPVLGLYGTLGENYIVQFNTDFGGPKLDNPFFHDQFVNQPLSIPRPFRGRPASAVLSGVFCTMSKRSPFSSGPSADSVPPSLCFFYSGDVLAEETNFSQFTHWNGDRAILLEKQEIRDTNGRLLRNKKLEHNARHHNAPNVLPVHLCQTRLATQTADMLSIQHDGSNQAWINEWVSRAARLALASLALVPQFPHFKTNTA
jgi:hypothetical protein